MNLYLRLLKLLTTLAFVRHRGLLEVSHLAFRVWPHDCDVNLHMNNGRYLALMDLGRIRLIAQAGQFRALLRGPWRPVLAAVEVSYIRALPPLRRFTLSTRLLGWDGKYFYLEHRFERGKILCAVALEKGVFLDAGRRVSPAQVLAAVGVKTSSPPVPAIVRHWNDLAALKKAHTAAD